MDQGRREFIKRSTLVAGAGFAALTGLDVFATTGESRPATVAPKNVSLRLLDAKPGMDTGVSFGVPWAQGTVKKSDSFILASQGKRLPVQSWPLAYWPDGSIKFVGLATVVPSGLDSEVTFSVGSGGASGDVKVSTQGGATVVDTGARDVRSRIPATT